MFWSKKQKVLEEELKMKIEAAEDAKDFEHDFHDGQAQRQVILAQLDAEIEYKKLLKDWYESRLAEKDKMIDQLIVILNSRK